MKTAMQELIDWIEAFIEMNPYYGASPRLKDGAKIVKVKATELLEKEKQQVIDSANRCSNVLIANEIVINGNQELTVGENYYNQTYN